MFDWRWAVELLIRLYLRYLVEKYYKPTVIFILAMVAFVIVGITVYDVWALAHGYEKTISWTLGEVAYHEPIVPGIICWVSGLMMGHLFWVNPVPSAVDDPTPEQKK